MYIPSNRQNNHTLLLSLFFVSLPSLFPVATSKQYLHLYYHLVVFVMMWFPLSTDMSNILHFTTMLICHYGHPRIERYKKYCF